MSGAEIQNLEKKTTNRNVQACKQEVNVGGTGGTRRGPFVRWLSSDFKRKAAPWMLSETSVCPLCPSVTPPLPSSSLPFSWDSKLAELKGGNGEGKRKAEADHGSRVRSVGEWVLARMGVWVGVGLVAHFL